MSNELIQPVPVARDENGWWSHPGIPDFDEDHERWKAWIKQQGLETTYAALEDEPETNPVAHAYFEQGSPDVSGWTPEPPKGEGWFTFSIHDTEDGPVWVWARRIAPAATDTALRTPASNGQEGVGQDSGVGDE